MLYIITRMGLKGGIPGETITGCGRNARERFNDVIDFACDIELYERFLGASSSGGWIGTCLSRIFLGPSDAGCFPSMGGRRWCMIRSKQEA
jgi:hypothetical protein